MQNMQSWTDQELLKFVLEALLCKASNLRESERSAVFRVSRIQMVLWRIYLPMA